jgi:hypothetical protein
MIVALVVLALTQVPMAPQAPPRDAAPVVEGAGIIRGRVVADDTGAPIRECGVMLLPRSPQPGDGRPATTRTNADGRFEFRKVPPGSYRVRTNFFMPAVRYLAVAYGGREPRDPGKTVEVVGAQVVEGLEIRLPRTGVLAGRVVDEFGEPMAFVHLQTLERVAGGEPRRSGGFGYGNGTDDLGRFRLFGLAPAEYFIVAEPQRYGGGPDDKSSIRHLPTYFPSTLNLAEATPVRVRAGQEIVDLEIRLLRGRTYKVSGTIMTSQGQPFSRRMGHVSLIEQKFGSSTGYGVDLREDGTFEARNVKPGTYILQVGPDRRGPDDEPAADAEFAEVPFTVLEGDVEGLGVVTQPGATIAGEVVFDEPPAEGGPTLEVMSNPVGRRPGPGFMWLRAKVTPDRTFVLKGLFLPRVVRVMNPPRGYWLSSVTFEGVDITDKPTEFKPGSTGKLVIALTRRASELSGRILDARGRPALESLVLAFSDDRGAWFQSASTTRFGGGDDKGEYKLNGLKLGRYLVIAIPRDKRPPSPDEGPEFWEALAKQATLVTIGDQERKTMDLKLVTELDR